MTHESILFDRYTDLFFIYIPPHQVTRDSQGSEQNSDILAPILALHEFSSCLISYLRDPLILQKWKFVMKLQPRTESFSDT